MLWHASQEQDCEDNGEENGARENSTCRYQRAGGIGYFGNLGVGLSSLLSCNCFIFIIYSLL